MIKKVKEEWIPKEFETSRYQNRIDLIKGWDQLIEETEESLANLSTMKMSQHFKTFEGEI